MPHRCQPVQRADYFRTRLVEVRGDASNKRTYLTIASFVTSKSRRPDIAAMNLRAVLFSWEIFMLTVFPWACAVVGACLECAIPWGHLLWLRIASTTRATPSGAARSG